MDYSTILRALDHIQHCVVANKTPNGREPVQCLMSEDWDWLVVMQTLIEQGLLPAPKQRPPFAAFLSFLSTHHVRTYLANIPSKDAISRVYLHINGASYPWADVSWNEIQNTLPRWRKLHDTLVRSLQSTCDE